MIGRGLTAGLLFAAAFISGGAFAQTSGRPNPPPQICANANCISTTANSTSQGTIKWNPGHYMASNALLQAGSTLSNVQSEMDDLQGFDNIVGYRVLITWGALEPSPGQYDFSLLDAILNRLKTHYNKPKHLVVVIMPGPFAGSMPAGGSPRAIPAYLQSSSAYGPSPLAGSYGWWGPPSGSGTYIAALFRPAVMDRMIALVQALGAHYDAEPYFEGLMFQEDAWMVDDWKGAPDYSAAAFIPQLQRLLSAATAAFPHTSIIEENTWLDAGATATESFEQWMVNHRIEPGSADTLGQSALTKYPNSKYLAWGLEAYMGIQSQSSSWAPVDLRRKTHAMLDIEAPDIAGSYYTAVGAPNGFTPIDIVQALNQTYQASHAFWTHLDGTEPAWPATTSVNASASWAKWSNLAPVINANPLQHTAYPPNYP